MQPLEGNLTLADGITARAVEVSTPLPTPLLKISANLITSHLPADASAREKQMLATIGSTDWDDFEKLENLRFSKEDGSLLALGLHAPEVTALSGQSWLQHLKAPTRPMSIQLNELRSFRLPSAAVRHYDRASCSLIGLYHDDLPNAVPERMSVAPDLGLLFDGGRLAGWILANAPEHLAQWADDLVEPTTPDDDLAGALGDFLELIEDEHMDDLNDGAPWVLERLNLIKERIPETAASNAAGRAALRERIDELVADWFAE